MDYASISSIRPDRPLTVKCAFDRSTRRIQFSSARNCNVGLLKCKVEEGFSLAPGCFTIAYKDDDGEVMDIVTDADLTEAILYFQTGVDDVPISSAASFYSSRSSGSRKITLRVYVQVDYDGPSLSDTSSQIGPEEEEGIDLDDLDFRDAMSLTGSLGPSMEPDDDQMTIVSRETGGRRSDRSSLRVSGPRSSETLVPDPSQEDTMPLRLSKSPKTIVASKTARGGIGVNRKRRSPLSHDCSHIIREESESDPPSNNSNSSEYSAALRYPADPSAVFERLKYLEATSHLSQNGASGAGGIAAASDVIPRAQIERGQQWLKEQSSRATLAPLIAPPSTSEEGSVTFSDSEQLDDFEMRVEEDLALQRGKSGQYYYEYQEGSSAPPSQAMDFSSDYQEGSILGDESQMNGSSSSGSSHRPLLRAISDPLPGMSMDMSDIPEELLPFIETAIPPSHLITDCSSCGTLLESMRYVCAVCGEKKPREHRETVGKGKGKVHVNHSHSYPPLPPHLRNGHGDYSSSSSGSSSSSRSRGKPLPDIPSKLSTSLPISHAPSPLRYNASAPSASSSNGSAPHSNADGYELCSNCIQFMGVIHAVEPSDAVSSPHDVGEQSPSPHDTNAFSEMRRSAPKRKGVIRHAYLEKTWAGNCWQEVEQDTRAQCSTCSSRLVSDIFKCASCDNFELCRLCYSLVHEIHPSHAFILVRGGESPSSTLVPQSPNHSVGKPPEVLITEEVDSMVHPGVRCAHCLLEIVGARFHCAICDSIDICANCESAGLPGNLTADTDGGHDSSHIMIKIPFPVESAKVQVVSRRAMHRWTDRDAPSLCNGNGKNGRWRSGSMGSDRGETVVGGRREARPNGIVHPSGDHGLNCSCCGKNIIGVRYQCATCPSLPSAYNLCSDCEPLSYVHHDPMHFFLKVVRPVDHPIESPFGLLPSIYKSPAGTKPDGTRNIDDPRDYIKSLYHQSSLCDVCMERIKGEWYRCVYCTKDLCRDHQAMDTHNPTHMFVVFKAPVDMAKYRNFTDIEDASRSPPLIPYAVYDH